MAATVVHYPCARVPIGECPTLHTIVVAQPHDRATVHTYASAGNLFCPGRSRSVRRAAEGCSARVLSPKQARAGAKARTANLAFAVHGRPGDVRLGRLWG